MDKKLYDDVVKSQDQLRSKRVEIIKNQVRSLENEIKELEVQWKGLAKSLGTAEDAMSTEIISERVSKVIEKISDFKIQKDRLNNQRIDIENGINNEIVTYGTFLNFFHSISQLMKKTTNPLLFR